jgi:hypothetical protein
MRIMTGTRNELQGTARERALGEEVINDPRLEMQASGHLGCHNRTSNNRLNWLRKQVGGGAAGERRGADRALGVRWGCGGAATGCGGAAGLRRGAGPCGGGAVS